MNNLSKNLRHLVTNKSTQLFFVVAILFLSLTSCSSDDNASSNTVTKKLSKIVDITTSGATTATNFTYNEDKIVSADTDTEHRTFTYTNDLITRVVTSNDVAQTQTIVTYSYNNDNLVKITSSENYVIRFVYNTDGTVAYEKFTTDSNNNEVLIYKGVLSFQNGNLAKDERIIATTASEVSKEILTYQYDSKNNPLHAIRGYSKLLDFSSTGVNNVTRIQQETRKENLNSGQITSSMVLFVSTNQYDDEGYLKAITSEQTFFGTPISNHRKTEFYFN